MANKKSIGLAPKVTKEEKEKRRKEREENQKKIDALISSRKELLLSHYDKSRVQEIMSLSSSDIDIAIIANANVILYNDQLPVHVHPGDVMLVDCGVQIDSRTKKGFPGIAVYKNEVVFVIPYTASGSAQRYFNISSKSKEDEVLVGDDCAFVGKINAIIPHTSQPATSAVKEERENIE